MHTIQDHEPTTTHLSWIHYWWIHGDQQMGYVKIYFTTLPVSPLCKTTLHPLPSSTFRKYLACCF
jgi:hypothetical protein